MENGSAGGLVPRRPFVTQDGLRSAEISDSKSISLCNSDPRAVNIMLFLGSGISLPTWKKCPDQQVPDVVCITKAVLSGLWKWNNDKKI